MQNGIDTIQGFIGFVCNAIEAILMGKFCQCVYICTEVVQVTNFFDEGLSNRLPHYRMKCTLTNVCTDGHLSCFALDTDELFLCETYWYGCPIFFVFGKGLATSWVIDYMLCHCCLFCCYSCFGEEVAQWMLSVSDTPFRLRQQPNRIYRLVTFSYIENTNLLPKQLFNFITLFFVYASIVLTSISMLSLSTKELVDVLITDIFM